MTIQEKIEQIASRCHTEKHISIYYIKAEYHPSNTGMYLSDLVNFPLEELVPEELLKVVKLCLQNKN